MVSATAAAAAPTPTAAPVIRSISVTGPANPKPITFRADKQPDEYNALFNEVSWMDGTSPDIFSATPSNLGPHYVVTRFQGSKVVARYDLYPDVPGGPRAHRQAVGGATSAWFFAPIDMSATLAAVGVKLPSSVVTDGVFSNKPKSTPLMKSISGIFRQSVTALALTGLGCLAILILLGAAARRSRAVDRRRTLPPAMARLNTVKAKAAAGPGAAVRPAIPGARRPSQMARPFATRLAALRRGTAVPDAVAPVSPPGVVRATAPVAVARAGILPAPRTSTGTRAKAAAKSLLARLPKATKAPATTEPRSPEPVPIGAGAAAAGSEASRASARASVAPPASARATPPATASGPSA